MNTQTTIAISEARRRLFDIADEVQRPGRYYTFTDKGRPKTVMMSATEFESWAETLEVMQDFPDLKKDIDRVSKDIESGAYRDYPTLDEILAKPTSKKVVTKKYAIHRSPRAARRKRT
ncbi:MAG: type II toxin-antitoxin system Phd/YefM family antitoxin [Candidatus Magasanikbacteria bacterium]|nr:type II toxin-antitoxin system Phd/YefM family antitoxin [Candidatus Magasanikbacteria bacterium]